MNQKQIEYLSKKIVQIANHIDVQLENKSALMKSYNQEIKDSKKRMSCYSKAVITESIDPLHDIMGEFELTEFEKIGKDNNG